MRISKLYLVVCAATLCAIPPTVRADDNPAQAAARAALEEQMRALDMQQPPTNAPAPAPVTPVRPAQPAARAPAQPAATTILPATPPPAANPPATETNQVAVPAATMQTTNEMNVQPAQPPPVAVTPSGTIVQPSTNPPAAAAPAMTPAPRVAPAQTMAPAPAKTSSSGNSLFAPVPPPSGSIQASTAPEENAPPTTTSAAPTAIQTPAPGAVQSLPTEPSQNNNAAAIPGPELGLKPMAAPPLPISAGQQAQLQALLEKYDAGTITPVQYQTGRAKILNQTH